MIEHGIPEYIRSENGPEFVAEVLRKWLASTGSATLYIEPGSPWENGYCESFNSKLREEFLNGEIFYSLKEAQILAERWRIYYNTERPHSSLGYRPPAPAAWPNETSPGHGKVGSVRCFPLFHTADPRGQLHLGRLRHTYIRRYWHVQIYIKWSSLLPRYVSKWILSKLQKRPIFLDHFFYLQRPNRRKGSRAAREPFA